MGRDCVLVRDTRALVYRLLGRRCGSSRVVVV